jgi:hypothetical protein
MGRITLFLDDETAEKMKKAAKAAGLSPSRWVAELIREKMATTGWPASVVRLAGAWAGDDFPSLEEIRKSPVDTGPGFSERIAEIRPGGPCNHR